ncbi:MAG TPA: site-specific integrase, partial [Candidatus Thermoplasmatota archaeon]|nr:site-specific integrase [Candidatus Thermoplasmatota archaeon]
ELYHAISDWWVDTKGRSETTVIDRIRHARSMQLHAIYPVDWFKFEPEQILNQLLFRKKYEYKELAKTTGNPTYGTTQLINLWKTVNMFANAYGIDISYWGWNPPTPPEPQVKIVPRPETVNRLIHHWYTNDRFENALIRTLLTVGFHIGPRPEELIILKVNDIYLDEGYIFIREQKKKYRERQVWVDEPVMTSKQQNSVGNWVNIWRPKRVNEKSGDFIFIQKNGSPFPSEDALRMYLSPFVKPIWCDFCPKIMRDWSAIARLIRTKIETKKWDTRTVKDDLGHKYEKTTESYIRYAKNYYRKDPYDWLRAVLKFHKNSMRMKRLMKQEYGPCQEIPQILTNEKNRTPEVRVSPVEIYGPGGI